MQRQQGIFWKAKAGRYEHDCRQVDLMPVSKKEHRFRCQYCGAVWKTVSKKTIRATYRRFGFVVKI